MNEWNKPKPDPAPAPAPQVVVHGQQHAVMAAHLTDAQVASAVRMLMRNQLGHEEVCLIARDRVLYLSQRLERAERLLAHVGQFPEVYAMLGIDLFLHEPRTVPSVELDLYKRA